jgi:hypothetical protein
MPVFSVQEIAKFARKDAKTIRRWCKRGIVPGAKRKRGGAGRHWRIEGESAATIAEQSTQAARGYSRERKRTFGGEVVPSEALQRFRRVKDRARLRRDETRILYEWATSRGECFDEGEFSRRVLTEADKVQQIAIALADFILMAQVETNHALFFGRLFGWSRATFYRKFKTHLRMARERADTLKQDALEYAGGWQKAGKDKQTGKDVSELVPDVMPEGMAAESPEQVRAWRGSLRNTGSTSRTSED